MGARKPMGSTPTSPQLEKLLRPPPREPNLGAKVTTAVIGFVACLLVVDWAMSQPGLPIKFALIGAGVYLAYQGTKRLEAGLDWGWRLQLFAATLIFPAVFYIWWPLTLLVIGLFAWREFDRGR
jgi:hypothetical protein